VKLKPVFGYLHRNHEKIGENTTYLASMPYTDRLDYLCSMTNNWAYALAVEKLAGQVPERAEYVRVILAELTRLLNHTCLAGFLLQDMGCSGTPLMYAFREREKDPRSVRVAERVAHDVQLPALRRLPAATPPPNGSPPRRAGRPYGRFLDEFEALITGNEILMARTQGVGVLSPGLAISAGITGPMLRASGVGYDLRKVDATASIRGSFPRPARRPRRHLRPLHGPRPRDARIDPHPPAGPPRPPRRPGVGSQGQGPRLPPQGRRGLRPHRGPQGRNRFLPHQRRQPQPVPLPRPPAPFINLTVLEDMCLGQTVADAVIILGSIDIVLGEVDR
jgi:NADH-quinone oxidoreductase subunit D